MKDFNCFKEQFHHELFHIYDFWKGLYDEKGGFYGFMDTNLSLNKNFEKGVILNSRILWFFSNVYSTTGKEEALFYAKHAFEFLINYCYDYKSGGVFWMLDSNGKPCDDMKHTYNQVFAVYGLSSYFEASKDIKALEMAYRLFDIIEEKCADQYGYAEAFSRNWHPVLNEKLSEDGYKAEKTMNTLLHLIEAYTELYRVDKNTRVKEKLIKALTQVYEKVYNKEKHILDVYFNAEMKSIADVYSYGHDIEASWLIDRAIDITGEFIGSNNLRRMNEEIVEKICNTAYFDGIVFNQEINKVVDKTRIWWIQCESVIGFLNGFQRYNNKEYLKISQKIWAYTKDNFVDKRKGSEWYYALNEKDVPIEFYPIAGPWKCPYHNGRMCLEAMNRL